MLLSYPNRAPRTSRVRRCVFLAVVLALLLILSGAAAARTIEGTNRSDRLVGTPRADVLLGRGGATG